MRRAIVGSLTILGLVLTPPAADAADPAIVRLAGATRYETAVAISEFHHPAGSATVFVATGTAFPDGLAGAVLAGMADAPLLLTDPNSLPATTQAEIVRLDPDQIVILGGSGAVGDAVADDLAAIAPVTRLSGANRYETAVAISQHGFPATAPVVVVATGTGFADALAGGPAAVAAGGPLLLTTPTDVPDAVMAEITRLDPGEIVLLGGIGAVGTAVEDELATIAPVTRLSGANRYETAVAISEYAFAAADRAYVATGLDFPDALSGAAAAAGFGAPILLATATALPDVVRDDVVRLAPQTVVILGGTAVVGLVPEHRLAYPTLPTLAEIEIGLTTVATGFSRPLLVVPRPGDARLFVVEQGGAVWSMTEAGGSKTKVLDVSALVETEGNEEGLLSIAFDPADPERMFICYVIDEVGDIRVAEYDFPIADAVANPTPVGTVITIGHPGQTNHNGGMLLFGPDGYLYLSVGDGGGGGDPDDNGQDPDALLGSILRLDVATLPYAIPATNPYADGADGAPEVWVKGVRNPWRISFDGTDLYVADVGQGTREELTVLTTLSGGANLGWDLLEGTHCYGDGNTSNPLCATGDFVDPVIEYANDASTCAITGGYVYRGPEAALSGIYFYADYCQGNIRALRMYQGAVVDSRIFADDPGLVPGFGTDASGRVYVVSFTGSDPVYRIDLTP